MNQEEERKLVIKNFYDNPEFIEALDTKDFDSVLKIIKKSDYLSYSGYLTLVLHDIGFLDLLFKAKQSVFSYYEGEHIFSFKYFNSYTIPDGVRVIENSAFARCQNLENVKIPESVTQIETCAFCRCYELASISFPKSLKSIDPSAFSDCGLEHIELPDDVEIFNNAFSGNIMLETVSLPKNLTTIADGLFQDCTLLEKVKMPLNVERIGIYAFKGCKKLKDIELPESLERIENSAFRDCKSLTTLVIPENVVKIESFAF